MEEASQRERKGKLQVAAELNARTHTNIRIPMLFACWERIHEQKLQGLAKLKKKKRKPTQFQH